ncbi:RHS repeat-associated core domain-containing protein [Streptomyces sp. NPDC087263]|uniref:RHS repeat-associated core domain-containing protein n=1 Tax=Streptomyces sp. NPDC087263 TaxID=3365773 RepID=UPI0038307695
MNVVNRPRDWHVLDLDKDPTPGDPDRVRQLSKNLQDFADDVGDGLRLIKGMADEEAVLEWAGKSAKAFQDQFSGVPKQLKKLKTSYDMAGDALAAYWPKLERAQALADRALADGRAAQTDLTSAKSRLTTADSWVTKAGKEADKYKDDPTGSKSAEKPDEAKVRAATRDAQHAKSAQTSAQSDVSSAQNALDAAKKMAEDARTMREEAAREAKTKIDEASDAGIRNRKWWEEVGDWFSDNWDTIVTVCKVVVAVVGIIAMIIGGPILGAIVLIAALVVLADTLNKYAKGQASLWDVAFAALDCIPGMKGLTTLGGLAKGLKGLRGGLKGMAAGLRGLKSGRGMLAEGTKGAYNRLKSLFKGCGDPVDPATGWMYLTQTDVALPGTLSFDFTRRVSTGYRAGRWFGPTWASTVDQRLEIDEDGVVFVTDDGMLLAYPHPEESAAPVLPESGPRWLLTRTDTGGYLVTEPLTGLSRRFATPADGVALLERIADRNHNTIDFDFDHEGTPQAIRHSGGYHLRFTVDDGRVTTLHLAEAGEDGLDVRIKQYGYADGNLATVTNSSGLPTKFTYDQQLRIASWEDTNRHRYAYTYDERDRCVSQGGEAGHLANTFTYDQTDPAWPDRRITEVTTAEGATTRLVVDDRCLVVAEIDPLGGTVRTAYDADQHITSTSNELGHTTRISNDEHGRPVEMTGPDGAVVRYEYNDLHLTTRIHLPDGASWRYGYDERGNCVSLTNPAGGSSHSTYTSEGHPLTVTDALGRTTTVRCNRAGLPVEVTDPLGTTTWQRDAFGHPVALTNELGRTTRLDWSTEGQLLRRITPDGAVEGWSYDGEGNCTSHTDQLSQTTCSEYTHFDLLAARTDPDGARYEFSYDASLRLVQVTNPLGMTWRYDYDAAGRLVSETDFDGRALTYAHDAAARLISRTDVLGQTITFAYDVLGQLVRKDSCGAITTCAYDLLGNLTQATGPDSSLTLERDRAGRLLSETVNGRTLIHAYDMAGQRVGRTTPSGAMSSWTYDEVGQLARLTASDRAIDFERDQAGREVTRHIGANMALSQAFDEGGRLARQSVTGNAGRSVLDRSFTYRADGNLTGIDGPFDESRRFDLDAVGRVVAVQAANWTESYAYDAAGNQTRSDWPRTHPGHEATGPRAYTGTRITRAGRVRYEHDDLGRIILRQKARSSRKPDTWHYAWDADDRLTSVSTPDGTCWRYTYDPLGRRTAKLRLAADGVTVVERVDFTWDGTVLCEQTTTATSFPNAVTLTWDHQGLAPIAQTERVSAADAPRHEIDSRFFAIVTDLVGTPTELIGETGDIAWRARSTLWGATAWAANSTAYTPLRFPGQYYDPETGLHYNYFRHYDPETARYLTQDPLGLEPAPNPSGYVDNPHTWGDPLGLTPCEIAARKSATQLRNSPGMVTGGDRLADVSGKWLRGSEGNAGRIPGQVARGLQGQEFKSFDHFRAAFWEEVSKHPELAGQFKKSGQTAMAEGKAPFVAANQAIPGQGRYVLHHVQPIGRGGGVYDLDNLVVVTPRYHKEILDGGYHYGS